MRVDERDRLHEHAGRAAARVVHPPPVGLQHLHQQLDDAARGVELTALLALGARELRQEILVDPAEHVLGAGVFVAHLDVADQVDELAEALLVEAGAGVILGQHVLERRVVTLDAGHRVVDRAPDGRLPRQRPEALPARLARHPEDVFGAVLVGVLGVGPLAPLRFQDGMSLLEGVGDVLEEDQPQHDVLVLGGVQRAAQGVGHAPQLGLMAGGGAAGVGGNGCLAGGAGVAPVRPPRAPVLPNRRP